MKRAQGTSGVQLLECTNPVRNKWRIRWDIQVADDGTATYMEHEYNHRPTAEEIRATVISWYNQKIDEAILSGFSYEDVPVWLSSENQFNYKAAHDLAVQTAGATLPVTFKFGTDTEPHYRTFASVEELTAFYTAAMMHIQSALADGWRKKDAFSLEDYLTE